METFTILIHANSEGVCTIVKNVLCLLFFEDKRYVEK